MSAGVERFYDDYSRMAEQAMMMRNAYHAKKLKQADLFRRPTDADKAIKKAEDARKRTEEATEWLSQFAEFSGKL